MSERETESCGLEWILRPGFPEESKHLLRVLAAGRVPPGFRVVKSNRKRVVMRGAGLVVKWHRISGLAGRIASLFWPTPSRREWTASAVVAQRGVPTPPALAFAESRSPGAAAESFIVFAEIADSVPAIDSSWRTGPAAGAFFEALGGFVRSVHDADVYHPDLHLGNVLARREPGGYGFHLIDLHSLGAVGGLSPAGAVENMAHVRNSLGDGGEALFERFLDGYFGKGPPQGLARDAAARESALRAGKLRISRHASRTAKALRDSSGFVAAAAGGLRIYCRRGLNPAAAAEAFSSFSERGPVLLKKDESAEVRAGFVLDGKGAVGKMYVPSGFTQRLKAFAGFGRGRRAYLNGAGLEVRGIPAAAPLALVVSRAPALAPRSAVFMEDLTGGFRGADAAMGGLMGDGRRLKLLVEALGLAVGRMHAAGVYPHDLKACNLMVQDLEAGFGVRLVDHDGVSFPGRARTGLGVRNLAQLNNSVPRRVSRAGRLRFLRAYCGCFDAGSRPVLRDLLRAVWGRSAGAGILWVSSDGRDVHESWSGRY